MPLLASYRNLHAPARCCPLVRGVFCLLLAVLCMPRAQAQLAPATPLQQDALEQAMDEQPPSDVEAEVDQAPAATPDEQQHQLPPYLPAPENAKRLDKVGHAWIDRGKGVVYVDGRISLRRGLLEMFACPRNTKEHESIVSVDCKALVVHAGLLAVGADTGTPVEFAPEYKPPTGTQIDITVHWKDQDGNMQQAKAQHLIRDARTGKQMDLPWVFAGSGFWQNEQTGTSGYMAEAGDLVCVANFSTATLDVPAELSNSNGSLLYEAFTERIPPLGWPVRLEFKPAKPHSDDPQAATDQAVPPAGGLRQADGAAEKPSSSTPSAAE